MDFVEAIKSGYNNYATFSGRSQRSAYWWWTLYQILGSIAVSVVDVVLFGGEFGAGILGLIWSLGHLIPSLAVSVRRLHDLDKSGWWLLIIFVPILGAILLIVWFCSRGTGGPNRFGNDPLAA